MYYRYTEDNGRESLVIHGEDISTSVPGSHPRFAELASYLRSHDEHDPQHVRRLLDTGGTIAAQVGPLSERVSWDGTSLRFDGDVINTGLSRHIVRMLRDGDHNYRRWVAFLEHLAANPSRQSRMHLYTWLDHRDFAITPDGCLLGYKGVRADQDNSSVHAGTAIVNGITHHGHIPNPVGATVEMPRSRVDAARDTGCSAGLHVGTHDYASAFGQRLLLVSVSPRDVVAVPRDSGFQKIRCCRYTVLTVHNLRAPVTTPSYDCDLFPDDCLDDDFADQD
jgi:hypothetical protein